MINLMLRVNKIPLKLLLFFVFASVLVLLMPAKAYAAKIGFTPASVNLTEGQSQAVQVRLDEPIICAGPGTCQVLINISSNASDRLQITTSPVTIPFNQWSNIFTFTVQAIDDDIVNGDITPTMTVAADSGSEYYNGFSPTFAITITDNDVAEEATLPPAETTNKTSKTAVNKSPELADTGINALAPMLAGGFIILASLGLVIVAKRR